MVYIHCVHVEHISHIFRKSIVNTRIYTAICIIVFIFICLYRLYTLQCTYIITEHSAGMILYVRIQLILSFDRFGMQLTIHVPFPSLGRWETRNGAFPTTCCFKTLRVCKFLPYPSYIPIIIIRAACHTVLLWS